MVFWISFTGQDLEPWIRKPDPHPWFSLSCPIKGTVHKISKSIPHVACEMALYLWVVSYKLTCSFGRLSNTGSSIVFCGEPGPASRRVWSSCSILVTFFFLLFWFFFILGTMYVRLVMFWLIISNTSGIAYCGEPGPACRRVWSSCSILATGILRVFIFSVIFKVGDRKKNGPEQKLHLWNKIKWPDKSTASYALLDFENDIENL